jgi:hypothetical protein
VAGRKSGATIGLGKAPERESKREQQKQEQEVMFVDEHEELPSKDEDEVVEEEAAPPAILPDTVPVEEEPTPAPEPAQEAVEPPVPAVAQDVEVAEDVETASESTDVPTPTQGASPKVPESALPELAPESSAADPLVEESLVPATSTTAAAVAPPPKRALYFTVPAGPIEFLVRPTAKAVPSVLLDGLTLELDGQTVSPAVDARSDALLVRLDGADVPARLVVSLSA